MDFALGHGTILMVVRQRDERRSLFKAFDGHFEAIYSAADIPQARSLLASAVRVDVILLEFSGDGRRSIDFCRELGRNEGRADMPIVGILQRGARRSSERPDTEGVVEWITAPFDPAQVLSRIGALLPRRLVPSAPAMPGVTNADLNSPDVEVLRASTSSASSAGPLHAASPSASTDRSDADRHMLRLLAELPRAG
ncbi:MAG: hypothetical protein WBW61_04790 [Rhodanobacteraceae bacterium]